MLLIPEKDKKMPIAKYIVVGTDILLANRQVSNINILPYKPAICVKKMILIFAYFMAKQEPLVIVVKL